MALKQITIEYKYINGGRNKVQSGLAAELAGLQKKRKKYREYSHVTLQTFCLISKYDVGSAL